MENIRSETTAAKYCVYRDKSDTMDSFEIPTESAKFQL